MKLKDIHVGKRYWTNVSGERVEVEIVQERMDPYSGRTKFLVRRVDTGALLPKARSPAAIHRAGGAAWPGMTEQQD